MAQSPAQDEICWLHDRQLRLSFVVFQTSLRAKADPCTARELAWQPQSPRAAQRIRSGLWIRSGRLVTRGRVAQSLGTVTRCNRTLSPDCSSFQLAGFVCMRMRRSVILLHESDAKCAALKLSRIDMVTKRQDDAFTADGRTLSTSRSRSTSPIT